MAIFLCVHNFTSGTKVSSIRANSSKYCSSVYSRTANFFLSAKFPGLIRTFSTHCAASIAASGLKWISATIGTSHPAAFSSFLIFSKLAASFTVGAVILTISHPTLTKSSVCLTDAAVSIVSHVIILCRRMGFFPPIPTFPTVTSRVARRRYL